MSPTKSKEYYLSRYHKRRNKAVLDLGGACVRCGAIDDLQIDHIDHLGKAFDIASHIRRVSEGVLVEELKKCQLLCFPCHITKTKIDLGQQSRFEHGTMACYRHLKCRCEPCRQSKSRYVKEWRRIHGHGELERRAA